MIDDDLFSLDFSIAGDFISSFDYPHEALNHIASFIASLDKSGYIERKEGVWVHETAEIADTAYIMPPCIICGNSCEIKNVIIFDEAEIPHFSYVGDSILGHKAHLGAGVKISNVRLDKKRVRAHYESNTIDTGMPKLGALIGDRAEIGCNSVINPGTVIARGAVVYPLSSVKGFIAHS